MVGTGPLTEDMATFRGSLGKANGKAGARFSGKGGAMRLAGLVSDIVVVVGEDIHRRNPRWMQYLIGIQLSRTLRACLQCR